MIDNSDLEMQNIKKITYFIKKRLIEKNEIQNESSLWYQCLILLLIF